MAVSDREIVIAPWIADLVRQYRSSPGPSLHPSLPGLVLTALVAIGAALAPLLLRLDRAAYPGDPEERQALEACGRVDPTFVRFFASDRAACYERFRRANERGSQAPQ